MKRRTLLKTALALPLAHSLESAAVTGPSPAGKTEQGTLYSGLAGLDYSMGGIGPGELICVVGPPCMGKTLLLLELAARISNRYRQNVLFYSAHKPSTYIAKKAQLKGDVRVMFAGESVEAESGFGKGTDQAAIHLLDSNGGDVDRAYESAGELRHAHPAGCAVLIVDGVCSYPEQLGRFAIVDGIPHYPAERWPHAFMSREVLSDSRRFSDTSGIPIVIGVTSASLMDDDALARTYPFEAEMRRSADHWVILHRPEIYRETRERRDSERNLVCLKGTSPSWWDTRCSELRFDPGRVGFSSVA